MSVGSRPVFPMLLFKPYHRDLILSGRKTETRRIWRSGRRAKPGSLHFASTRMFWESAKFATLLIEDVWQELLAEMSEASAQREGYTCVEPDFRDAWTKIHGKWEPEIKVWVVRFHVKEVL